MRVLRTRALPSVALTLILFIFAVAPPLARGTVLQPQTIDGPSADVLELGGVAMTEDGTGGLVYRKRADGRPHIFAAQFNGARWLSPQRVDVGQAFDSSWPRIGAGDGGRLVVTWVQERGPGTDRLFSASLDPGARRFQAPVPVDLNVGEATSTYPSLGMSSGGSAYLSYRVLTPGGTAGLPPGYVFADSRLARYDGSLWSQLGSTANRNPSSPVSIPTAANSPKVCIDVSGNGIVAFQEPDEGLIDRIWARRIFGGTLGNPLVVSPQQVGGTPLRGPADGFALDGSGLGGAAVAFRQQPGERSPLSGPHIFVNALADAFGTGADNFGTPAIADGAPAGLLPQAPGVPDVSAASAGSFLVTFGLGPQSLAMAGTDTSPRSRERLDDSTSTVSGDPVDDLSDSGAAVTAWKVRSGGRAGVVVRERRSDGLVHVRPVSALGGGQVNDLLLSGSGLGDALIALQQGTTERAAIAAATVDAPPLDFKLQAPDDWVRSKRLRVRWDPARNALGPVAYTVAVGDEEVASGRTRRGITLRSAGFGDGRHELRVVARDTLGQETQSSPSEVKIDRNPPRVLVRRWLGGHKRVVLVRILDGPRSRGSGPRKRGTVITFGDGRKARGIIHTRHVYRHVGVYRLRVSTRDRAGNRTMVKRRVRVP